MIDQQHTTSIYSNEPLSLNFMQKIQSGSISAINEVKDLGRLKESLADTISVVVTDRLDCLELVNSEKLNCLILIVPQSLPIPASSNLSKMVIYRRFADETAQVAVEKIFSSLIKFTAIGSAYIDTYDINLCLSFQHGRFLKIIYSSMENIEQLSYAKNFISQLTKHDSIIITTNTKTPCIKESFHILKPLLKQLGENFDRDIFWGCISNENSNQDTDFYILQACAS